MAERIIRSRLVPIIRQYCGDDCRELKICVLLNVDLLALFREQQSVEGISYDTVRSWARRFPSVEKVVTMDNLKRWLAEDCPEAVVAIGSVAGGWLWLEMLLSRVRREFFGP
jgi:hypothetical protein